MDVRGIAMLSVQWVILMSNVEAMSLNPVIVGGEPVSIEEVPFLANLVSYFKRDGSLRIICGASILNERFVLSAAHCTVSVVMYGTNYVFSPEKGHNTIAVRVGTDKLNGDDGQFYGIEKTIVHPKFDWLQYYLFGSLDYDAVVLKLQGKIMYSDKVQPVKMAGPDLVIRDGDYLETIGFGATSSNPSLQSSSEYLRKVAVPYVDAEKCNRILHNSILEDLTDRMICAGEIGKDSCQGDSGGPLTFMDTLVGVVSFGAGCATSPGVYASVPALRRFIDTTIEEYS